LNYIGYSLSAWSGKLSRWIVLHTDGPEALRALDPDYAEWLPVSKPVSALSGACIDRLAEDIHKLSTILGLQGGSNNWAMKASRTSTGRPILANDPHLWPGLPNQWYLVHIQAPNLKVAGASFVGAPLIPSGHNEVAAWGVTAGMVDNTDLFVEEFQDNGNLVRTGDQFTPCEILRETIHVKGGEPVEEEIILTPRGAIISDVLEDVSEAIAMRATWMTPRPVDGMFKIHHAKDFETFRDGCSRVYLASLNLVYADINDNIGWQLAGEDPSRGDSL